MPREKLKDDKPGVLVTQVDWRWNHGKKCSDKIPSAEPTDQALKRWGETIRDVVSSVIDYRDISMGDVTRLERVATQIENAKEYS